MITYELALELKKAGFFQPQGTIFGFICDTSKKHKGKKYAFCEDCCYNPTLSELIEACGDRFNVLERQTNVSGKTENGEVVITKVLFIAIGFKYLNPSREMIQCASIEPDEAVAKLWLELNK